MRPVTDYDLVLLDAMIINNFASAGAHRQLASHLGGRLATTTIVAEEVSAPRYVTEPRRHILDAIRSRGTLIEPTAREVSRIDAMATPATDGGRPRDRGEASLVVCAAALRGERIIVLDDRDGARLAQRNGIDTATGRRLLCEMILAGVADEGHSWRMAERCFGERDRTGHLRMLRKRLQQLERELDA